MSEQTGATKTMKVVGTITFSTEWLEEYMVEELTPEKIQELVMFPFQEFGDHLVTAIKIETAEEVE